MQANLTQLLRFSCGQADQNFSHLPHSIMPAGL